MSNNSTDKPVDRAFHCSSFRNYMLTQINKILFRMFVPVVFFLCLLHYILGLRSLEKISTRTFIILSDQKYFNKTSYSWQSKLQF